MSFVFYFFAAVFFGSALSHAVGGDDAKGWRRLGVAAFLVVLGVAA